jgi:hypothetical protein
VAILLSAVPPFYTYSGGLEVQSGVVIGIFLSSLVLVNENLKQPRETIIPVLLFITALLLPLYKDPNTFVLIVGLAIAASQAWVGKKNHSTKAAISQWRRTAWSLVIALSAALTISLTYNFAKGGSVLPLTYLNEVSLATPRPAKIVEFFAATYFSPNGGVIAFWGCALCATVWLLRRFELEISRAGASVALAVALIYSVILSCWWATFGWDAWGDRLMIPAMLATIICLTATARERSRGPEDESSRLDRLESEAPRLRLARVVRDGAIAVLVLPSLYFTAVSYYANRHALVIASLFGGPRCAQMVRDLKESEPRIGNAFWRTDSYYACARERFIHVPVYIPPNRGRER